MDMALAGQIIGRILLSYILVWIIMLIVSRFDFKRAFYHTHRWYGFIVLVVLFALGLSSNFATKGMM